MHNFDDSLLNRLLTYNDKVIFIVFNKVKHSFKLIIKGKFDR